MPTYEKTTPNAGLAKSVIHEIVRQLSFRRACKTAIFKAFWKSHVFFAGTYGTLLTDWPIIRMNRGPGIGRFDELLDERLNQQADANGVAFTLAFDPDEITLTSEQKDAIARAVEWVGEKTPEQLSDESHQQSWQWNELDDQDEMDVFLDLVPESEYRKAMKKADTVFATI